MLKHVGSGGGGCVGGEERMWAVGVGEGGKRACGGGGEGGGGGMRAVRAVGAVRAVRAVGHYFLSSFL